MFNDKSFEKKGLMAESFASDYEDAYDEMLNEMGAAVLSQYSVSRMLKETDPIAYRVGMNDYESSLLEDHQYDSDMYSEMFDEDENLTPTGEKMLKEMYDEMLDESGVESLLNNYDASRLLKETDPIAYRVGLSDYESSMEEDDRNVYRDMAMQRKGMMAETFEARGNMNVPLQKRGDYHYNCPYCKKELTVIGNGRGSVVAICENENKRCHGLEIPRQYLDNYEEYNWYVNERKSAETFGAEREEMCQMCGEKADGMIDEKFAICHDCDTSFGSFERSKGFKKFGAEDTIVVSKDDMYADFKIRKWIRAMEDKGFSYIIRKDQTPGLEAYVDSPSEFLVYEIGNIDDITNWIETDSLDYGEYNDEMKLYISTKNNEIYTSRYGETNRHASRSVIYFPAKGSGLAYGAETFGADGGFFSKYPATYYKLDEEEGIFYLPATDSCWLIHGEDALTQEQAMEKIVGRDFKSESSGLIRLPTDEPNFDPQKADRNKDGKISSWERTVGNKVAKGIREGRKTSSKGIDTFAEPFEDIGISKPYARLGVIAAGITALAFGVKKLRK